MSVGDYALRVVGGSCLEELWLEAGIACGTTSGEDAEGGECDGGGGADGCDVTSGCVLLAEHACEHGVGGEVARSGHAAGTYEHFGFGEVAVGEHHVGLNFDAVRAGDGEGVVERDGDCVYVGATQEVGGGEGFDFFKTVGKEDVDHFYSFFEGDGNWGVGLMGLIGRIGF